LKKGERINHSWFEITFFLATNPSPTGEIMGFKDGAFKVLNNSSQPIVEGAYFKEDRIGLWTHYYYNQGVKVETKFIDNRIGEEIHKLMNGELLNGTFTYFDEVNGIKELRKIKNGLRNGKTTLYDSKTNQIIKKTNYKDGILK
jgi:antitoxin component YwqK of YwqJK toxin-antitoxin module